MAVWGPLSATLGDERFQISMDSCESQRVVARPMGEAFRYAQVQIGSRKYCRCQFPEVKSPQGGKIANEAWTATGW